MKDLIEILKEKGIYLKEKQIEFIEDYIIAKQNEGYSIDLELKVFNKEGLNSPEYEKLTNSAAALVLLGRELQQGEIIETPYGIYILGSKFVPSVQANINITVRKGNKKRGHYVIYARTIGELNFDKIKELIDNTKKPNKP